MTFKLIADQDVRLTYCKRGRVVLKPVNAKPGLKVNRNINIYVLFCVF